MQSLYVKEVTGIGRYGRVSGALLATLRMAFGVLARRARENTPGVRANLVKRHISQLKKLRRRVAHWSRCGVQTVTLEGRVSEVADGCPKVRQTGVAMAAALRPLCRRAK